MTGCSPKFTRLEDTCAAGVYLCRWRFNYPGFFEGRHPQRTMEAMEADRCVFYGVFRSAIFTSKGTNVKLRMSAWSVLKLFPAVLRRLRRVLVCVCVGKPNVRHTGINVIRTGVYMFAQCLCHVCFFLGGGTASQMVRGHKAPTPPELWFGTHELPFA